MKLLKRSQKNLFILEAGYIYCLRRGIEYSDDKFADGIFMSENFDCREGSEYDNICKDLRNYRQIDSYQLTEITIDEYNTCCNEFGFTKK